MKTKFWFISAGLSGALALSLPAQTPPAATAPAVITPARAAAPKAPPVISLDEAQQKVATAPVRYPAHPAPAPRASATAATEPASTQPPATKPDFVMAAPPPAPRPETKPAAPAANLVWVPGHYMPVKGQWVWVAGEWSTPATPSSVWIPARYETAEKSWTPGYWQPDRPAPTDPNAPASEAADGNPVYR